MSYNGSGVWTANSAGLPVVTGTTISSTMFNALTADLATGLSTAVCKDGQQTTTQLVPFAQGISTFGVALAGSAGSGQIGFIQSGTGAVARTVQAKERDAYNVKDFGAVVNGVTDDSAAIQAAVDALPIYGGIIDFPPGPCFIGTGIVVSKSKVTFRGTGGGDYTVGSSSSITTSVAALNGISATSFNCIRFENIGILNTAVTPTGRGITLTNCQNCELVNVLVKGWDIGLRLATGAIGSFNCTLYGGQILSNVSKNIDAQASSNGLRIFGTEFGGTTQIGLAFKDSNSLYVVGACEGPSVAGVDIDATTPLNVAAYISIHNENSVMGNPTGGVIRLGATAKVIGVTIDSTLFYANVASTTPVNALNASVYTLLGCTKEGTFSSDQTISAQRFQDPGDGNGAFDVARDANGTGSSASFNFTQKNASNAWKKFARMAMTASGVVAGSETAKMLLLALFSGAETEIGALEFDGSGTPSIRSNGVLRLGGSSGPRIISGANTPEGAVVGIVGDIFLRTDGGASTTLYVKTSGAGDTGWTAK